MEEDKIIRRKRTLRLISKVISYTIIIILMIIASFLIFFAITGKIAESKNQNPPYSLYTIVSPSMTPSINVYDVILVKNVKINSLKVGDVITFYSQNSFFGNTPITHRIVEIIDNQDTLSFKVKGDANEKEDSEIVLSKNIIGKVIIKFPKLGKLQYFLASKKGWILAIVIPTLLIISYDIYKLFKLIMLRNKLKELSEGENFPLKDEIGNDNKTK